MWIHQSPSARLAAAMIFIIACGFLECERASRRKHLVDVGELMKTTHFFTQ
jgi:hypothetical protein